MDLLDSGRSDCHPVFLPTVHQDFHLVFLVCKGWDPWVDLRQDIQAHFHSDLIHRSWSADRECLPFTEDIVIHSHLVQRLQTTRDLRAAIMVVDHQAVIITTPHPPLLPVAAANSSQRTIR